MSKPVLILAIILALVAAGWSAFWVFAARQTETLLAAWIEREKTVGRIWTCPDQKIAGYPFDIAVSCGSAGFSGKALGKDLTGSLNGFQARASLFNPKEVEALATPPFRLSSAGEEGQMTLRWSVMRVRLNGGPQDLMSLAIDGKDVSLEGGLQGIGNLSAGSAVLNSTIAAIPERRAENAYAVHLTLQNAAIPMLDGFLGSPPPDAFAFDGIVTKADFELAGTLPERIDQWRQAGGQIETKQAIFNHGGLRIAVHGLLQLDEHHRLDGRLNTELSGAEPLLRRFGINPSLISAGSLLASLLGGRPRSDTASNAPAALHLPVAVQSGLISVGPVKTNFAVPPLY